MPTDNSKEFFEVVDEFVRLANELNARWPSSRISSAMLYAAARYNAFNFRKLDASPDTNREQAVEYFCEQYREMLLENFDTLDDKWTLRQHPSCGGVITVLAEPVLALDKRWLRYSPEGEKRQAYQMFPHKGAVPIDG